MRQRRNATLAPNRSSGRVWGLNKCRFDTKKSEIKCRFETFALFLLKIVHTLFYRNLEKHLALWAKQPTSKPLIIRGARQVGKTTLVQKISTQFDYFIPLNLEKREDRRYFESTDNVKIIFETLLIGQRITIGNGQKVLLFIDEIQQYPQAIALLRYFYEELPQVYVIAAGSLLEFALGQVPSMPVGRVEQVVLHPMSFDEFLLANNHALLFEKWDTLAFEPHLHQLFLGEYFKYMVVGGMPAAVRQFVEDGSSFVNLPKIFDNIWLSYREDSAKYQKNTTNQKVLQYVMEHAPYELDRFSFASLGQTLYKGREISEAFDQLEKAKILSLIYPTTALKPPISPNYKKRPRIQFLDTGLLLYINQQSTDIILKQNIQEQFRGGIFNHVVLQEIIAHAHSPLAKYMFWVREEADTNAEVDLVLTHKNKLLPIEVKAGANGRLRSLFEFIDRTEYDVAVRILDNQFSIEKIQTIKGKPFTLINVPVYAVGKIYDILEKISSD